MRTTFLQAGRAALIVAFALPVAAFAQQGTRPAEGIRELTPRHHALTNARIVTAPGRVIERGTVVVLDGRIASVEDGERVPAGARRWDLAGKTVYAGFIDLATVAGLPQSLRQAPPPAMPGMGRGALRPPPPAPAAESGARHWNRRIRPERDAATALEPNADDLKALRALGFTAALAVPDNGILRGDSALITLRDSTEPRELVLAAPVHAHAALESAPPFSADYPVSTMGAIALLRQTLADARWQRELLARTGARAAGERPEANLALAALAPVLDGTRRLVFALNDELDVGRVVALGAEYGLRIGLIGTGTEYRVAGAIAASAAPVIVPLNFPAPPEVERPETALSIPLAELQHWEQAPANAARLADRGVPIALTTRGLKDPGKEFWPNLRRAVAAGLGAGRALAALTTTPAELLGEADRLGRIAPGQLAQLVVADADLFTSEGAKIYEVWTEGIRHELAPIAPLDPRGTWTLTWSDGRGPATIEIDGSGPYEVRSGGHGVKAQLSGNRLVMAAPDAWFGEGEGTQSVSLMLRESELDGLRALADGTTAAVRGVRAGTAATEDARAAAPAATDIPPFTGYPAGEHARGGPPAQPRHLLVRGATVWTMGAAGRIDDGDLLVREGRIVAVGRGLAAPSDALVIDGRGRHLTPGLIDAHSHTALSGNLNEASHAVTTEVRVADIVDPTDINVYRQLAGGVTTALLLHGSANPMGGQSHTVKWRWGADAAGYAFEGAKPGVKFALGENVKQSNWGDGFTTRYPQTRMGVEQIMLDSFNAAREYDRRMAEWRRRPSGEPPRRDLRLEALAEILRRERVVHIHSYRQDEILMFVRLAQRFGFEVATFTHILEGYKVADQLAALGAGASSFADWWAFKVEVYDAIPHNAALLTRQGVLTSINSDSDEMARRLNAEAAKAMRYGGLTESEALALVTVNPARQLRVEARVGSLEPGKDADFVLWDRSPLSSMARVEQTWIDGRKYFDAADDAREQALHLRERERLVERILPERLKVAGLGATPRGGEATTQPGKDGPPTVSWWHRREAATHTLAELALMYATQRGIYHSGQDVLSCSVNEHAH